MDDVTMDDVATDDVCEPLNDGAEAHTPANENGGSASGAGDIDIDVDTAIESSKKDASTLIFYSGFTKGMMTALEGLSLFAQTPSMISSFGSYAVPMMNLQAGYIFAFVCLFLLVFHSPSSIGEVLLLLWRWSRVMTIVLTTLLDIFRDSNHAIYNEALRLSSKSSDYVDHLNNLPKVRKPLRYYLLSLKRVVKLMAFKLSATVIKWFVPNGQLIAVPTIRFLSMRPILGSPIAAIVAATAAVPEEILQQYWIDDLVVSFGEAVVDADDYGSNLVHPYVKKLDLQTRAYFTKRYRGYIVGLGFVYSLLSAIPFVGIPIALVSECGAACLIVDITKRNLEKSRRRKLPGEEYLTHVKQS